MFLFGGRKASAWSGYSSAALEVNADDGWRRYAWTPPCGTVFQLRKWPL
jgi:hypothetical protein